MREYIELFLSFMKIGGITFGGGYAMLPMIQREIVDKKKWASEEEIIDYFAVAQCTPGVIAVNTATFVGHRKKGIAGGIIATLGVVSVPVIIICIIATALKAFSHIPVVQSALHGISVAVCATILASFIKMFKSSVKDYFGVILFTLSFIISLIFDISPVYIVIIAAILGIVRKNISHKSKEL